MNDIKQANELEIARGAELMILARQTWYIWRATLDVTLYDDGMLCKEHSKPVCWMSAFAHLFFGSSLNSFYAIKSKVEYFQQLKSL